MMEFGIAICCYPIPVLVFILSAQNQRKERLTVSRISIRFGLFGSYSNVTINAEWTGSPQSLFLPVVSDIQSSPWETFNYGLYLTDMEHLFEKSRFSLLYTSLSDIFGIIFDRSGPLPPWWVQNAMTKSQLWIRHLCKPHPENLNNNMDTLLCTGIQWLDQH